MRALRTPTLFAVILFCGAIAASATEPAPTPAPALTTPAVTHGSSAAEVRQRQIARVMQRYESLNLTEEQKNQIRPLVKSQVDELRALRMDSALSEETRQARALSVLDSYRTQIASLLTADQKVRLEQIRIENRKALKEAGAQRRRGQPVEDDND